MSLSRNHPVPDAPELSAETARRARRIVVAGNDGSGKSTLCQQLSVVLGVPYTNLDTLRFGPDWKERPGFMTRVSELAGQTEWITEWDFDDAREELGSRAELFIWIDLPRRLNVKRTLVRSVRARIGHLRGGWFEPPLHTIVTNRWHSVRIAVHNHNYSRHLASTFIEEHPSIPSVRLRSPLEVAEFRSRIAGKAS